MIKLLMMLILSVSMTYANSEMATEVVPDLTLTWVGISAFAIFIIAYYFIAAEDKYEVIKAKPALFAGTFMFCLLYTSPSPRD